MKIFWIKETNTKACSWSNNKLSHFSKMLSSCCCWADSVTSYNWSISSSVAFFSWHRATIIWILLKWIRRPAITPKEKYNNAQHITELLLSSPLESPTGEAAIRWTAWLFKFFWWRKETFSMRWHRIDQDSCYDYDEAKGGRERTQEKSGLKFRNTLHTDTHLHLKAGAPQRASRLPGIMRRSRSCFKRAHFAFRTFHTVQSCVKDKNCSCSCAPTRIDNQIQTQRQFYVSLQVEHDNINTPSDIVHYVGHCIISFTAS